ncbi:MAG: histidine--tRNA ligase [Clostridiales bacterium]|nr:histidine--tRNA ligase [Clostridiales bacterium]
MALITKAPRGTADALPGDSCRLAEIEKVASETASTYGFGEIRTPVFEHTELFDRGVGGTTDVVQKEMYTFDDNSGRSLSLRPEGTAGAARAFIEHGLFNEPAPQKFRYGISCFRYEKPQSGRLREFHQFGVESFGSAHFTAETEVIELASRIIGWFGIEAVLRINSIGCRECRGEYRAALKKYFAAHTDSLCDTCKGRLETNPLRILDCKNPECHELAAGAPVILDYLCDDCRAHFEGVKSMLDGLGIKYEVDPMIVRGLDYYTRTVFEFVSPVLGAQGTVCGGGRYDGLVEELGGPPTPACGFGMGLERMLLAAERSGYEFSLPEVPDVFVGYDPSDPAAMTAAARLVSELRDSFFYADFDVCSRSVKAQMKYAGKKGARFTAVIGGRELESGEVSVKNMRTGEQTPVRLDEFCERIFGLISDDLVSSELSDEVAGELAERGIDIRPDGDGKE